MSAITNAYSGLLIKQYWRLPRSSAEIEMKSAMWETIIDGLRSIGNAFDIDASSGDRLDIIGRIVGMPRRLPSIIAKVAFGFADNPNDKGFADKFNTLDFSAPFQDKFEPTRTDLELDDTAYRFFIKVKVAYNNGSAYMVSDSEISIQEVISTIFKGEAYVVDAFTMALSLYVSPAYSSELLLAVQRLGLLPRPQGVRFDRIIQAMPGGTLGFSDSPSARGFSDKFDPQATGGIFASKVI